MIDNETIKQATEMRKAHLNLAKYCLDKGYSITVDYGTDEDACTKSTNYAEIKEHVEACDEAYMHIYNQEGRRIGWAWVIFGNDDNELISDYSATKFMDTWSDQFQQMYESTT